MSHSFSGEPKATVFGRARLLPSRGFRLKMTAAGERDNFDWPREILADEQLLWSGQPPQGLRFYLFDLYLIPFGMLSFGFAVLATFAVLADGHWDAALWILPFLAAGFFLLFGIHWLDRQARRATHYALTNERIYFRRGIWRPKTRCIYLSNLQDPILIKRWRGTCHITFGRIPWYERTRHELNRTPWNDIYPVLELKHEAESVCELIRETKHALEAKQTP